MPKSFLEDLHKPFGVSQRDRRNGVTSDFFRFFRSLPFFPCFSVFFRFFSVFFRFLRFLPFFCRFIFRKRRGDTVRETPFVKPRTLTSKNVRVVRVSQMVSCNQTGTRFLLKRPQFSLWGYRFPFRALRSLAGSFLGERCPRPPCCREELFSLPKETRATDKKKIRPLLGGRCGIPGFKRVFVSTTSLESSSGDQQTFLNDLLWVVVVYVFFFPVLLFTCCRNLSCTV